MTKNKHKIKQTIKSGLFRSIEKTGTVIGNVMNQVSSSDLFHLLIDKFCINWFFNTIMSVDIDKTQKQVEKFKTKYPNFKQTNKT